MGVVGAVLAGLLFGASGPPLDLPLLAWLALAPLLLALDGCGAARAAGLGACFAAATVLSITAWLPAALVDGFGADALAAGALWIAVAVCALPAAVAFAVWMSRVPRASAWYLPMAAAAWGLVELSWAQLFPRLPWVALAAGQADLPLAPLAAIVGVHGSGAWLAACSALLVQAAARGGRAKAAVGAACLALLAGFGAWAGAAPDRVDRSLRVALVQPALPMSQRERADFERRNLAALVSLSRAAPPADLLVWPESAFLSDPAGRPERIGPVQRLVDERGTPLLAGGRVRSGEGWRTVAMLVTPGAAPRVVYAKRRLLPLAESVPGWLPAPLRRRLGRLVPSLPVQPGATSQGLEIAGARADLSICFEAIFQRPGTNADVLINLVNDGWYDAGAGAPQHLMLARWRAIERGAPLVRAAATGISAFVRADGVVDARLEVGEAAALVREVAISPRRTPFERVGNAPLLLLGAGLFVVFAVFESGRLG